MPRKRDHASLIPAKELLRRVDAIRAEVVAESDAIFDRWAHAIVNQSFIPGARNLGLYLALRRRDLSDLQPSLTAYGLTSLGRSEAHVMATLEALLASLALIGGATVAAWPPPARFAAGERALRGAQKLFFGDDVIGARTRIMVTLPTEAATDRDLVRDLIRSGMTCARINCAHDDAAVWRAMAEAVRTEASEAGQRCKVLMDIGGPKCRVETVVPSAKSGCSAATGSCWCATCPTRRRKWHRRQHHLSRDPRGTDGRQRGLDQRRRNRHTGRHRHPERVRAGSILRPDQRGASRPAKGVNFPDNELHLTPLTQKIWRIWMSWPRSRMSSASFVQRPEDLTLLYRELSNRRPGEPPMPVILKIETPLAVRNLPRLIVQAGGAGLGRGHDRARRSGGGDRLRPDGGRIQEEIMWLCEAAHIPVIWATQVLDGLVSDGIPSRGEATDAAMGKGPSA